MGLSESVNVISNRWDFVVRQDYYSIVRDKRGREGEEYEISVRRSTVEQEQFAIYNLRKISPHQLVAVYDSQLKSQPGLCTADPVFRVITEHMNVRLCESFELNAPEVMYLLSEAIKGYQFLYSKVGCFAITPEMMGLTAQGELRVWMHKRLAENAPQYPKNSILTVSLRHQYRCCQQENFMVKQIFSIITSHAQRTVFQRFFSRITLDSMCFDNISSLLAQLMTKFNILYIQRIDVHRKVSLL